MIELHDGNAQLEYKTIEEAAVAAREWYDFLVEDPAELTHEAMQAAKATADERVPVIQDTNTLNAWLTIYETALALAEGKHDWVGHGNYFTSAADQAGYGLAARETE